ncbi:hypothetical protein [Prochlorothrix hollandica]|nr:hypothetical protein [Prochlorothrix hollandica]
METLVPYIQSISDELLSRRNRGYKPYFEGDFNHAVNLWSKCLLESNDPTEINQLVKSNGLYDFWKEIYNSQNNPIVPLVYIYSPGKTLYSLISRLLGSRDMDIKIIVILAFIAVSISYTVWKLQKVKQRIEEQKKQSSSNSQGQNLQVTSTILQTPQNISTPKKYSLILAISASKEAVLPALYNAVITQKDYKELYKATQSMRILETDQIRLQDQTSQFHVAEVSEYDIYLVKLDLRQKDDRFGPDQDQMDRYDAFQNLPNLVTSIQISSRLTMDVCTFFKLYVR